MTFKIHIVSLVFILLLITPLGVIGQQPNPPGQVKNGEKTINEAYLFAHMYHNDYGRLYYSVSLDGLHWNKLNSGKRVFEDYKGHPDIVKGPDNKYYITGNTSDASPDINIWVSDDLISWKQHAVYTPNLKDTKGYTNALQRIGAPKLFYDRDSEHFVLTWHTPHEEGSKSDPERYWASQRTLYVLSKDLKTFNESPNLLFSWNFGTIDAFIRKVDDTYYAILKDETYPTLFWPTGKTVRIARSKSLLGPYSLPSDPISPNFREAPTLIPSPNGKVWYLYYEQYPGVSYGLSIADNLNGPWFQASGYTKFSDWDKYRLPEAARHGCMITISKNEYDNLIKKFGISKEEPKK
ncbi:glycoside hydrolase family 43 protein [Aestuariibaculum sp. M13]|uniref:glycoside hydrolase family 43 protein n=1 Tax=Aestuariibaculum sp. M13 TaxID=2967132 RepID=UPI002159E9D0|nr:glycoside hydrolase family 43 protein [Aestuariibaculum sp. M13]MCR8668687.1 glycoside hydrolase family 43 protein [Aestuariibaculum sp. M13]